MLIFNQIFSIIKISPQSNMLERFGKHFDIMDFYFGLILLHKIWLFFFIIQSQFLPNIRSSNLRGSANLNLIDIIYNKSSRRCIVEIPISQVHLHLWHFKSNDVLRLEKRLGLLEVNITHNIHSKMLSYVWKNQHRLLSQSIQICN